jgi:quercetin dioxygenase-like cupin family protein
VSVDRVLRLPTGEVVTVLRTGADSAGALFEVEAVLPPGLGGPPPHRHRRETETFTVVEGVLRVRTGRERRDVLAGESVVVPPGTVHAFANPTDTETRIRMRETPAGPLEEQFEVMVAAGRLPPLRAMARVNVAHDCSFELHGLPGALQRPLWRLLAALPARRH